MAIVRMWLLIALCLAFPGLAQADAPDGGSAAGHAFEKQIEAAFAAHGFGVVPFSEWNEAALHRNPNARLVVTDAPYKSIYGHKATIEFLIIMGERQILLETKEQTSPGSTDEKLPYVYENALANLPEREFALLAAGDGWKDGAIAWIENKAKQTPGFHVFRTQEALFAWLDTLN